MKKILITGKNSYIGNAAAAYLEEYNRQQGQVCYQVEKCSLRKVNWELLDFTGYDTVLHVAGMAHADVGKVSEETKQLYYQVNQDLTVETARRAKAAGVQQFIYVSSIIVYGDSAGVGKEKRITAETQPAPANFYGDSKLQAEKGLKELETEAFHVALVRPPFVYGNGCKGNYKTLEKLAEKLPVFPKIKNERSTIYVENLTEFFRRLIESGQGGLYFPQNRETISTSEMVKLIAAENGKKIHFWGIFTPFVTLAAHIPGKVGGLCNKAFGSLTVDKALSQQGISGYQRYSLEESIRRIYENRD